MSHSLVPFQQIFQLYSDINLLEINDASIISDAIVEQNHEKIITFHRYGFVFFYFDQLVRGLITQDQFLTMGDVEWSLEDQINPHVYRDEHPVHVDSLTPEIVASWTDKDLIILDRLLVAAYIGRYGALDTLATLIVLG